MKRVASCLFLVVLFLFGMNGLSWAIEDVPPGVDSERAAQVFAGIEMVSCNGSFGFDRWQNGRIDEPFWGQFEYDVVAKMITRLSVRDAVIIGTDDKPRKGFPRNEVGEARAFYVFLSCFNGEGKEVTYGNFQKDLMLPEDAIDVGLTPLWRYETIPFVVPDGVNPEDIKLVLYSSDSLNGNWKFDYQQDAGGFSGYFNPLEISTYEITDVSTGKIFATGKIDPLAAVSVAQNNGHAMNLVLPVGVTEVKFVGENNFQSFSRQQLNGQVADCVEPPSVTPVYERVPLSTAEQILQMGAGRTLYKFRATAPYDADASINLVQFSTLAWSNSGLQLDFLSLYAYTDSDYSVPYIRFDPTGRVAPSSTANGYWALPSNERGKVSFEAVEGKDAFLTISAGTTLYFALRADISGFVPAIGACAFISTNMSGLSETVLYTHDECTTGGGMGAPIPSPTSPPVSGDCLEETLPAKVYFMDLEGWALDVYIYGLTEGNIEIRRWIPTGEMPVLVSEDFLSEYGTNASIKAGYGKVIVTITGVLRNPDDGFYINFQRSFLPAIGGGMGGGKG